MGDADKEFKEGGLKIKQELTGRFVYSIDQNPITYEIREYRTSTNEIILRRLFDPNGILLNDNISIMNMKSANEDTFFTHYQLYQIEDERVVKHQLE